MFPLIFPDSFWLASFLGALAAERLTFLEFMHPLEMLCVLSTGTQNANMAMNSLATMIMSKAAKIGSIMKLILMVKMH